MVGGVETKSEITAISNKYKDTLDDFIDSSDIKFPDRPEYPIWPEPIDKKTCNTSRSKNGSPIFLEKDCKDKNILFMLYKLTPKIQNSQVY